MKCIFCKKIGQTRSFLLEIKGLKHFTTPYMESPPPAVFHDKAKRTQQGNLLEVHYYMVNIAYFTELNCQICDYAQKQRICRKNCKYTLDEKFHGHFCPRRKAAKFCHPGLNLRTVFPQNM